MRGTGAMRIVFSLALVLVTGVAVASDPPPLPEGLGGSSDAPALPEGLGGDATNAPALPEGLGGSSNAPALPEGLGESTEDTAGRPGGDAVKDSFSLNFHGYWEARAGVRTQPDPAQPDDASIAETRLQLTADHVWEQAILDFTGDVYLDGVLEEAHGEIRQFRLTWTPFDDLDIRLGRQVLTWGTGDMLFINDLFPKDWQSFFIGRDVEYLKAPGDAIKVGYFNDVMNVELVYTPQFDPDRFISGERISYWNPLLGHTGGQDSQIDTNPPSDWFEDDEIALRLYRSIGASQLAFYAYSGYWKSPAGLRLIPLQWTFPKLRVYGASLRGPIGKGIGNIEIGYYDSYQDRGGTNPAVNNSELRLLLGYEQEIGKDFTGAIQYYLEHMMDYSAYQRTKPFMMPMRDRDRHVVTLRLTKLLLQQTLTLSFFGYYSPSDGDAYLRPNVSYKITDRWRIEGGANLFMGESPTSFFGQFEDNTNVYAAIRYSF